jgi:hypothetical protein
MTVTSTANITGFSSITPPVAASTAPTAAPVAATSSIASASKQSSAPVSPQLQYDPSAGLITVYLNSSGQIEMQIPSATVVAYLRAGLTSQGLPQPQNTEA